MEYDDRYNPTELNDIDQDDSVLFNSSGKLKQLNKGYHKLSRKILYNNKIKIVEIGVYGSGSQGSSIRNAETGEYYKSKVGSKEEDLFFKVRNATCETSSGSLTLFYESPSEYENHHSIILNDKIKQQWKIKKQSRLLSLQR